MNDKYRKEKTLEEEFLSNMKQRGTRNSYTWCPRKATGQNVNILLATRNLRNSSNTIHSVIP